MTPHLPRVVQLGPQAASRRVCTGALGSSRGLISNMNMSDSATPMDCSPSGSSVHGILLARILEWVAIPFARASSLLRDGTEVSCFIGRCFYYLSHQRSPMYESTQSLNVEAESV